MNIKDLEIADSGLDVISREVKRERAELCLELNFHTIDFGRRNIRRRNRSIERRQRVRLKIFQIMVEYAQLRSSVAVEERRFPARLIVLHDGRLEGYAVGGTARICSLCRENVEEIVRIKLVIERDFSSGVRTAIVARSWRWSAAYSYVVAVGRRGVAGVAPADLQL